MLLELSSSKQKTFDKVWFCLQMVNLDLFNYARMSHSGHSYSGFYYHPPGILPLNLTFVNVNPV